jgi:hypothetical protein
VCKFLRGDFVSLLFENNALGTVSFTFGVCCPHFCVSLFAVLTYEHVGVLCRWWMLFDVRWFLAFAVFFLVRKKLLHK